MENAMNNDNRYEARLGAWIKAALLVTMIVLIADLAKPSLMSSATTPDAPAATAAAASTRDAPTLYFPSRFGAPDDPSGGTEPMAPTF
jgi:hypothetical protein